MMARFTEYSNPDEMAQSLANKVAEQLTTKIKEKGRANMAVPGGTTPGPFLTALSRISLDWENVYVMLGDERLVDENSPRSNTRLVRETLLQNHASQANLVAIFQDGAADISSHLPLDVLVVGMGADMHTASLFPDAPGIADAMASNAPDLVTLQPASAPEARISLSGPLLKSAHFKHVLIIGTEKLAALKQAEKAENNIKAPIRVVIDDPNTEIHYSE